MTPRLASTSLLPPIAIMREVRVNEATKQHSLAPTRQCREARRFLSWGLQANSRTSSGYMQCPTVGMNPPRAFEGCSGGAEGTGFFLRGSG